MSFYGGKTKIDGLLCGLILRGNTNGEYQAIFEREHASIEQIETINWRRPKLSGPCELPQGYGFDVTDIKYSMGTRAYTVSLKVREQYLGDVTGYQAQIDALEEDKVRLETDRAAQEDSIQRLTEQLAEADEMAISLYEELEAAQEQLPAEEPDETAAPDQNGEPDESGEVAE